MIEPQDEERLRERVRKSLQNIVSEGGERTRPDAPPLAGEPGRIQAIVDEETELFWANLGLGKHRSRSGRAFWVTPQEEQRLGSRRRKLKHRLGKKVDWQTAAIWIGTALFAALLLAYLFATEAIG